MAEQDFRLAITHQSVLVQLDAPGRKRLCAVVFFVGLTVLAICGLLFLSGKNGSPSIWHAMAASPVSSMGFLFPLFLVFSFPLALGLLLRRYVTLAWPSDEKFYCDGSSLTISKVYWLDFQDRHWQTWSYPLPAVRAIQYRAVASARGYTIYGLRFHAGGKTQRVLPGLMPRDAEKILLALKTFGADVPDDPFVSDKIKENQSPL